MDKIVWPNYVEEHAFLFDGGDVEGVIKENVVGEWGIKVMESLDVGMEKMVGWAVQEVLGALRNGES